MAEKLKLSEDHERAVWAWRQLRKISAGQSDDILKAGEPEEYFVPCTAGVAGAALDKLGLSKEDYWQYLRGRPVARVFAYYVAVKDRPKEERKRLVKVFAKTYGSAYEG